MKNVLKPLDKCVLISLGLTAAALKITSFGPPLTYDDGMILESSTQEPQYW